MTAEVDRYRWKVEDDQFAASFVVDDFPGFFRQQVIIEPGTRALIVSDGQFVGEVPPGTYTLKGMREKLRFLTAKQATVILTRQEDFPLQTPSARIANTKPLLVSTKENLSVSASIRITVQIDDVALFHRNLMGANSVYTTFDLEKSLRPLLQQSLWESVSRFSITELTTPEVREQMDAAMEYALSVSLKRYGLRFIQVQLVAIRHKDYENHREKDGQRWLQKAYLEQKEADNDLEILAENIELDHHEAKIETKKRRISLQNGLLETVRSKTFDQIAHKEELADFLQERNKGKLLRKEELDELVEGYENRKDDRDAARSHLITTLSLQRRFEQEALREDLRHALRLKRLDQEIELAENSESKDNLLWRQQVQQDRREAEHRYDQHDKKLLQRRAWIVRAAEDKRDDEWENLIHQERVQQQEDEMEYARTERQQRLVLLKRELEQQLSDKQLDSERRRREQEIELSGQESENQLQRLAAVQKLNLEHSRQELELKQQQQRLDQELDDLSADKQHLREIAKLQTLDSVASEVLIATSGKPQSKALADLKKHEASQETAVNEQVIEARLATERARIKEEMLEKLRMAEKETIHAHRENKTEMHDLLKEAISSQQPTKNICQCGVANPGSAKFCSNCGNQL